MHATIFTATTIIRIEVEYGYRSTTVLYPVVFICREMMHPLTGRKFCNQNGRFKFLSGWMDGTAYLLTQHAGL
jgi:hypothetical protein